MKTFRAFRLTAALATGLLVGCTGFSGAQSTIGRLPSLNAKAKRALPMVNSNYGPPSAELTQVWNDINAHWWDPSGHIVNVGDSATAGNGYPTSALASGWERTQYMFDMDDYAALTGDQNVKNQIAAEWNFFKSYYTQHGYTNAVYTDCTMTLINSEDDAGWMAMYYLAAYRNTGDGLALQYAEGVVNCSYAYFSTGGGPLNYSVRDKGYGEGYEVGLMTAAYEIYQITHDPSFRALAMQSYGWLQHNMQRPDGVYWDEWYDAGGYAVWFMDRSPASGHADDFLPAQSVSSILENTAMAVMNIRLYNETGDDSYRQLAMATVKGIVAKEVDQNGVLVNDRDGWADGAFLTRFAREVVPWAGPQIQNAFFNTAASIMNQARTSDGYYGADWGGGNVWESGATAAATTDGGMCGAHQIMTTANTAAVVLAAATIAQAHPVTGNVDGVSNNAVSGWACAQGVDASINVDVYIGGDQASATFIGRYPANQASEDGLAQVCQSSGAAYRYTVDLGSSVNGMDGQNVYVYGISPNQGANNLLAGSGNFQVGMVTNPGASVASGQSSASSLSTPAVLNSTPANAPVPSDAPVQADAPADTDDQAAAAQAAAQATADAQAQAALITAARQAAEAQQAAVAAAAQESQAAAQAAAAQAFAARQTQAVYRYVGPRGNHAFARNSDGSLLSSEFQLEGAVFNVYVVHYDSTAKLMRCNTGGHQFLSTDPNCEGQTIKGDAGFVSTIQVGNLIPLYRMLSPGGDRLEDTSTDEGTGAGYSVEGVLGFVPPN